MAKRTPTPQTFHRDALLGHSLKVETYVRNAGNAAVREDAQWWLYAAGAAEHARLAAEEMLVDAVAGARAAGASWSQVGSEFGITKQAAQQRFGSAVTSANARMTAPQIETLEGI